MEKVSDKNRQPSQEGGWKAGISLFVYTICFLLLGYAFSLPADKLPSNHVPSEQVSFISYLCKYIIDFAWIGLLLLAFGSFKLIKIIGYPPRWVPLLALASGIICSCYMLGNSDAVLKNWVNLYFVFALMLPFALLFDDGFNTIDDSVTIIVEDVLRWATLFPVLFTVMFLFVDANVLTTHSNYLLLGIIVSVYLGIYVPTLRNFNFKSIAEWGQIILNLVRCTVIFVQASFAYENIVKPLINDKIEKSNFECLQNQIEALEQNREKPRCNYLNK